MGFLWLDEVGVENAVVCLQAELNSREMNDEVMLIYLLC